MAKLPPHLLDLLQESFWKKKALKAFLRRSYVSESFLSTLDEDETKREWLDRLVPKLERTDRGQALLQQIAFALAGQTAFPDLQNWENSVQLIRDAKESVSTLKAYLDERADAKERQADIERRKELAAEAQVRNRRLQSDLAKLKDRLDALALRIGEQQSGYDFQDWFYDLMGFAEIECRRPYVAQGRQIDGSVTIDGTTYLVELKFEREQAGATEIDSLNKKVTKNALSTMGVMVAVSGYSSVAKNEASTSNSPLLLLDHAHIYMVLTSVCTFADLVRRVRRHASQEGKAYLSASDFGG